MRRARWAPCLWTIFVLMANASLASSQSNLSTQGLGFPPGQLSTQAQSMGGSIGEADPLSPLNPAATGLLNTAIVMFQAEPEYRELRFGTQTQRTSVSRFPLIAGALPLGSRWALGISASTLLDRTWETTARDSQIVNQDTIRFTRNQSSDGSIADVRLSVSFAPTSWLKIGVGGHGLSGRDVLRTDLAFDDTARFARDVQQTTLSFGGNAVSVGAHALYRRLAAIGASYRRGGSISVYQGNTTVGRGYAPDHYGVSVMYLGIAGTALAVRAAKDDWTRLEGTAPTLTIHNGWDLGVGADVTGPSFGGGPLSLRVGGRSRTLPFSATPTPVREKTGSFGFALPMARGDVQLSFGVLRASRTSDAGVSEKAWTLSTGFAIRP
jgi:hypothetical protein